MVLGLITQWLNPLREFLAPSFSPQLESAAPLLALRWYGTGTVPSCRRPALVRVHWPIGGQPRSHRQRWRLRVSVDASLSFVRHFRQFARLCPSSSESLPPDCSKIFSVLPYRRFPTSSLHSYFEVHGAKPVSTLQDSALRRRNVAAVLLQRQVRAASRTAQSARVRTTAEQS